MIPSWSCHEKKKGYGTSAMEGQHGDYYTKS